MRLFLMVCFVAGCGGWSKQDTILELTSAGLNATDGLESRGVVADNAESNPIIGRHGENVPLGVYVPVTMLLHAAVSAALPKGDMRTGWQMLSISLEGVIVMNNMACGYEPWSSSGVMYQH